MELFDVLQPWQQESKKHMRDVMREVQMKAVKGAMNAVTALTSKKGGLSISKDGGEDGGAPGSPKSPKGGGDGDGGGAGSVFRKNSKKTGRMAISKAAMTAKAGAKVAGAKTLPAKVRRCKLDPSLKVPAFNP